jgi:hypothetical protein
VSLQRGSTGGQEMMMDRDGTLAVAQASCEPACMSTGRTMPGAVAAKTARRSKPEKSERIAVRISRFLAERVPRLFCDDCITDQLDLSHRRQANRVTAVFGKDDTFWRDIAACSLCRKHKQVIRHV